MAAELEGAVIVGGGPSGLAAAIELRRLGLPATVIERERDAGGIPRHCGHSGFGIKDMRRMVSGPRYAGRYRELASEAGVELLTETMVTDWGEGRQLGLTGPAGRREIAPRAVLLATGARERPRSARLVPGDRGIGVMTTSTLQQLVYLHGHRDVGSRAVIVGAEHVSFSAVATLAHGGARVAGMVTELPRHQSLAAFRAGAAVRYRAPLWTRTAITGIRGVPRVEEVELTELDSGATRSVAADLVVFTADWIPDHELAVMAGCELDPGSLGPRVDAGLRSAVPGVFAAGNVTHPAETADVAALGGRHAASAIAEHLRGDGAWPARVPFDALAPLRWVAPGLVGPGAGSPARGRFLLRSSAFLGAPRLEVRQGAETLWRGRLRRLSPGRSASVPAGWTERVDVAAGAVTIGLAGG